MSEEYRFAEIRMSEDPDRGGPGIIEGVIVPYGKMAGDRRELFMPGSLEWREEGVILNEQHNRQAPIMRIKPVADDSGVRIKAALPDTQRGRDAAAGIRNGTYTGLSVQFIPRVEDRSAGVRRIKRAKLTGVGLVDSPSYDAPVSVRQEQKTARKYWY